MFIGNNIITNFAGVETDCFNFSLSWAFHWGASKRGKHLGILWSLHMVAGQMKLTHRHAAISIAHAMGYCVTWMGCPSDSHKTLNSCFSWKIGPGSSERVSPHGSEHQVPSVKCGCSSRQGPRYPLSGFMFPFHIPLEVPLAIPLAVPLQFWAFTCHWVIWTSENISATLASEGQMYLEPQELVVLRLSPWSPAADSDPYRSKSECWSWRCMLTP